MKKYVNDTNCFVNSNCINHVLDSLNSFHRNIKFTIEIEKENKVAFLNILLIHNKNIVNINMHRRKTNTGLYINWNSFVPSNWKWGKLKTIVSSAYHICSSEKCLKKELNYIETVIGTPK